MLDILAYLFERYCDTEAIPDAPTLSRRLQAAGFEREEIDDALGWLKALADLPPERYADLPESLPVRILHPLERQRLDDEAQAFIEYLLHCEGVLAAQRECVLDLLLSGVPGSIDLESAQLAALMVLWRQGDDLANLLIEEILYAGDATPLN